ncbi:NmrA domain-containing protein [Favolaschia claudopus]|uniref:NmrA domain-containing protein n=1 Tax=Favolaschia claudopus TaxID=2862362 RepID=A0AAV9ZWC5_9AGAR
MASSRIVAVLGATGNQGESVVRRLLKDGTFTPRAITRDPSSAASIELKKLGAEVVKGDTKDKASLVNALRGSEGLFAVTLTSFPPYSAEKPSEVTVGKTIIDVAKEVGVKFIVFSSVPGLTKLTGGKYKNCSLYDDKEEVEDYLKASGVKNASLHLGSFMENIYTQRGLKKTESGKFAFSIPKYTPEARQSFTWVGHDVGEAALALFKHYNDPSKDISGKVFPVVTGNMPYGDYVALVGKALGQDVSFNTIPTTGNVPYDEMFAAQAEYNGFYTSTPVPNPDLAALGAKFATIDEFIEKEIKKRFL